ncbi:uncharacterized protein LOC116166453 [Photinus pyralis]|uniref:uncharacterized protein LOC116166453 n=1 Tax=Photinus pyralis TaxID=7054 RepID=UPI0012673364|nr:uncharacterized protein LOC116166453 [Photinus pyralis]
MFKTRSVTRKEKEGLQLPEDQSQSSQSSFCTMESMLDMMEELKKELAVSETWLHNGIDSHIVAIENYNFLRKDRGSRGGGVGIYVKSNYKATFIEQDVSKTYEQLWLRVVDKNKVIFIVGVVYTPPNTNVLNFIAEFEDAMCNILPIHRNILCAGRF